MIRLGNRSSSDAACIAPRSIRGSVTLLALVALVASAIVLGILLSLLARQPVDARAAMRSGDYERAAIHYATEADNGDPAALNALGNLHYLGLGIARDERRAAQLYLAAAGRGHAAAQINLGNLYAQGLGVPLDAMRAFAWYNMASIHGSPAAEYYLYQISVEYTLSPLQQSTAAERWRTLELLLAEGL